MELLIHFLHDRLAPEAPLDPHHDLEVQQNALNEEDSIGAPEEPPKSQPRDTLSQMNLSESEKKKLLRSGLFTALAIGLHNIPEGLATFIATLANPSFGVSIAIAIALHNIPEGVSVSIPTFFATGNRWKSICWTVLSAMAEPFGAVIGYAIVRGSVDPVTFGGMFGFVSGIMMYVAVRELLPHAHKYDPQDLYSTKAFFAGVLVMALSIQLF